MNGSSVVVSVMVDRPFCNVQRVFPVTDVIPMVKGGNIAAVVAW